MKRQPSTATAIASTIGPIPATTYIVAELGPSFVYGAEPEVNVRTLLRMIDAAADAGADCVKMQAKSLDGFYVGDDLSRPPHDPVRAPFRTRGEYVRHREPDLPMLTMVAREARARGMEWSASPWDLASVELLADVGAPWIKIASACLCDHTLLAAVRDVGVPVVLSTGMSTLDEIDDAVKVLTGTSRPVPELTLAVCTAAYPATVDMLHLRRIPAMRARYGLPVGWSSHCPDPDFGAIAVAFGAEWLEAHITSGTRRWGPDHAASLDFPGFHEFVWRVRETERAGGSEALGVLACEAEARRRLRRAG